MRLRHSFFLLGIPVLLLVPLVGLCATLPDMPPRYVVDLAGVIDDGAERRINGYLQELEQKTTAQVIVLTVDSLEGIPLEDYSLQVAEKWKLGQRDRDNGLLLLFAMKERKYRFEVGYGLEGILPDSLVGSIGRDYIVPYFRQGDYTSGVAGAALAVANVIAEDSGVEITGMPKLRMTSGGYADRSTSEKPGILGTIFSVIFFIGLIYLFIRHPRLLLLLFLFSGMGGRRSSWGGGGGFGGGGFGSFGGGGGGGFGGGGASGGW